MDEETVETFLKISSCDCEQSFYCCKTKFVTDY